MIINNEIEPCIYRESKHCGRKIDFFIIDENLLLTKKPHFEILITRKMNELRIDKKYHPLIINSLEVLMPVIILMLAGFLLAPKK